MQFVGTFSTLYHHFDLVHSLTLYEGSPYSGAAWFLSIGLLAVLGWAAYERPSSIRSAAVIGYGAPALGALTYTLAVLLKPGNELSFGAGYYLIMMGQAFEVAGVALACAALLHEPVHRGSSALRAVAIAASIVIGASAPMLGARFSGQRLWLAAGLPVTWTILATAAMVAVASVPLFAVRLERSVAAAMLFALATSLAVGELTSLLQRLDAPDLTELTIGFWLTLVGVLLLVAAAVAALNTGRAPADSVPRDPEGEPWMNDAAVGTGRRRSSLRAH